MTTESNAALKSLMNCKAILVKTELHAHPDMYTLRASRPLVGPNVRENDFFFYSDIDIHDEYALHNIETNINLDARVLFVATDSMQELMAVVNTPYWEKYFEMPEAKRKGATAALVAKLKDKTLAELTSLYFDVELLIND